MRLVSFIFLICGNLINMLTIGEQNAVRDLKQASQRFLEAVEKEIKFESMKAANKEAERQGLEAKYKEQDFLDLL